MEKESDDGPTNKQTDRISSCRLDPFCRRGRVKRQKRGYAKKSDLAPSISDAGKFQTRTKLKPTMFNSTSAKAISDLIYDSSIP